jgi:hypothetical protein
MEQFGIKHYRAISAERQSLKLRWTYFSQIRQRRFDYRRGAGKLILANRSASLMAPSPKPKVG